MKSVYLTKNQKNKKTIGRSENPNRQKSRWAVNTFSSKDDSRHTSNRGKDQDVTVARVCTNNNSGFFTLVVIKTSKLP